MAATSVLLVEDDEFQREAVREYLSSRGMSVTAVETGEAFRAEIARQVPDLILLDVRLPGGENGHELARWMRDRDGQVGIIMLTASGELVDRVVGLEFGADDYITKPFEPRELLARMNAVLRRSAASAAAETVPKDARIRVGAVMLNLSRRILVTEDGREIGLGSGEFELLRLFVENPNRVLERDWLLEMTAGDEEPEAFDRAVDLRVMRLRRKVERDPSDPRALRTVRGAGYMFVPDGH